MMRPTRVTRLSPLVAWWISSVSHMSCVIDRNFSTSKRWLLNPSRGWRKKIGPGLSSFTASATSSISGHRKNRMPTVSSRSSARFTMASVPEIGRSNRVMSGMSPSSTSGRCEKVKLARSGASRMRTGVSASFCTTCWIRASADQGSATITWSMRSSRIIATRSSEVPNTARSSTRIGTRPSRRSSKKPTRLMVSLPFPRIYCASFCPWADPP